MRTFVLRKALAQSTAILTLAFVLGPGVALFTLDPSSAWAAGGTGGSGSGSGGAGGVGPFGGPGGNGSNGTFGAGGGGGGAGGGVGGNGGQGALGAPGLGGQTPGANGAAGNIFSGAGGGAGGANGTSGGMLSNGSGVVVAGGNGGNGGIGSTTGGGGGGGEGGYGAVVTGTAASTNLGTITGGNGGNGGNGSAVVLNSGGDGGDGGVGIYFAGMGATLVNSGTIAGGNGGSGGFSFGLPGSGGTGGAGIVGSNLTIINSGTVSGGLASDGITYASAITFTGGSNTLQIQAGSTIIGNVVATGTDKFQLGGTLNSSFDVSQIGPTAQYQGFSTFEKVGTSTWTLAGTTTAVTPWIITQGTLAVSSDANLGAASGGLTFNGGTLQALGSFTSARDITLTAAGGTVDTNGFGLTLSGPISGAGGLSKAGAGTLTLSGSSTYAGPTFVNAGTLQAGAVNAFSASSAFTVASGAVLDLNGFSQTIGALSGSGNVTLGSGTLTTGGDNTSALFSGAISGTGGLTKVGTGTFFLTGASPYTGDTTIQNGILSVNGALPFSTVFVANGGTLQGNGLIGGLAVQPGGTVAPGNSIGTLSVNGNVTFGPGSLYQVEANAAGQSDNIIAGGTATLSGGTVQVLAQSGVYRPQTTYLILSAQDGVSGAFTNVTSNLAFLDPALVYTAQNVFLTLTRNDVRFCDVAVTFNQCSTGNGVSAGGSHSALYLALVTQTEASARQAFDVLSGEVHADTVSVLMDDSRYIRQAVLGRLRQAPYLGESGAFASLGMGGPVLAYAGQELSHVLAYGEKGALPAMGVRVVEKAPAPVPGVTFWTQAVGAWGRLETDGNAATTKRDLGGFFSGVDTLVLDGWRIGAAGGYTHSDIKVDARASRADVDTTHLAAYAGHSWGPVNLRLGGAYAWHDIDTSRSIVFPGFAESATASYHGETGQAFGELGYGFLMGQVAAEPFAGLAWVRVKTGRFAEQGGVAALFGSADDSVGYTTLGLRAATNIALANGMALIPRVSAAWQHAFADVTPRAALAFESTGAGFAIQGVPIARDSALVEAGFDVALTPRAKLGLSYVGTLAERTQDHAAKGTFSWNF